MSVRKNISFYKATRLRPFVKENKSGSQWFGERNAELLFSGQYRNAWLLNTFGVLHRKHDNSTADYCFWTYLFTRLRMLNMKETVDEWKTNLMSLAILSHLLCAQHVSDINISIFRSLRLCWWITTSVVLFSVRCVLEFAAADIWWFSFCRLKHLCFNLQNENHQISAAAKTPTHNELRTRRPMR